MVARNAALRRWCRERTSDAQQAFRAKRASAVAEMTHAAARLRNAGYAAPGSAVSRRQSILSESLGTICVGGSETYAKPLMWPGGMPS